MLLNVGASFSLAGEVSDSGVTDDKQKVDL